MGFVIQRFHPLIRPGLYLSAVGAPRSGRAVHSHQSRWDSACVLHCLAMVPQIAGLIDDPSRIRSRRRRPEATLWSKAAEVFLKGMTFRELAAFISELDCGLRTRLLEHSSHRDALPFIERDWFGDGSLCAACVLPVTRSVMPYWPSGSKASSTRVISSRTHS